MVRIFIALLLLSISISVQGASSLDDIAHDADSSIFYGDFFHAYRDYSFIETENQNSFADLGVEGYLRSLFILGSDGGIERECARLSTSSDVKVAAKASYLCGHHFIEVRDNEAAIKILKKISASSHFYWPGQICLATAYIVSNIPQMAIDALKQSDLPNYTKFGLADEFYLSLARAYTAENKFDDALKNYQGIGGNSPFYIETLEESAWIFFKIRHFESAQVLLDALIGNYESAQRVGNMNIPLFTYYRARYLRAYQALSEKRTEGAAGEFVELRNEYGKAIQKLKPALDTQKVLAAIHDQNIKWTDVHDLPQSLKDQLDFISQWAGADVAKRLENEVYYQMALSRELARGAKYNEIFQSESPGYLMKLEGLRNQTWGAFASRYDETVRRVARDMETIKIKAELGRLEIVWLKRAEGARSLDEVIDNYRQEARSIDEFMAR